MVGCGCCWGDDFLFGGLIVRVGWLRLVDWLFLKVWEGLSKRVGLLIVGVGL